MTKPKTYWAVFTGRGAIAADRDGLLLIEALMTNAKLDLLWFEQEFSDKKATVRKVQIVEVKK